MGVKRIPPLIELPKLLSAAEHVMEDKDTAHAPKIHWNITEQDALDILTHHSIEGHLTGRTIWTSKSCAG